MIKQKRFSVAVLVTLMILYAPVTPLFGAPPLKLAAGQQSDVPSDAEQAMFTRGQNLYNQGHYEQAAAVLTDFLKNYPNSIITDLTLLWLGRSYMQMGRLTDAEQIGQRLHAIKDTPFVDIYDGELQAARHEMAARTATNPSSAAQPSSAPRQNVSATNSAAAPTSSPTPATSSVAQTSQPQAQQVATIVIPNENSKSVVTTGASAHRGNGGEQTRLVKQSPPTVAANGRPARRTASNQPPKRVTVTKSQTPERTGAQVATNSSPPTNVATTTGLSEPAASTIASVPAETGGLSITVKQVPNLNLALRRAALAASPGQAVQLPLVITNSGNKEDQFRLETDLPAEYQPTFSLAQGGTDTGLPILVTPQLARGASLDILLNIRVPETASDGQQRRFFVRAASQADYQITRVADAGLTVVAATLAGSSSVSQETVLPGETFRQTIVVRNAGSGPARSARADFVFNPDFELVSATPSPLVYDRASRTAIWSLGDIDSHDGRDISVTLRAVPDALAATRPLGRGTMRTVSLSVPSNFDGPSIAVGRVTRARIDAVSTGLTATPGDVIYIPFIVRNPGNYPESYELRITAPGAPPATIYADTNADGQHQENEPAVGQTAQLEPHGGQYPLLMRVEIPRSTPDRQQYAYHLVARSLTDGRVASEADTVLSVTAPHVRVRTEQVSGEAAPGDTIFYRLVLVNEGGGLAKNLIVTEQLPDALQFVNSDPALNPQDAPGSTQRFVWRVGELAPNDTAVLRIAVRFRTGLQAETTLSSHHTLTYQDTNGNNYRGQ